MIAFQTCDVAWQHGLIHTSYLHLPQQLSRTMAVISQWFVMRLARTGAKPMDSDSFVAKATSVYEGALRQPVVLYAPVLSLDTFPLVFQVG
jgi:hypothetical protein